MRRGADPSCGHRGQRQVLHQSRTAAQSGEEGPTKAWCTSLPAGEGPFPHVPAGGRGRESRFQTVWALPLVHAPSQHGLPRPCSLPFCRHVEQFKPRVRLNSWAAVREVPVRRDRDTREGSEPAPTHLAAEAGAQQPTSAIYRGLPGASCGHKRVVLVTKEADSTKAFAFLNAENTLKSTEWLSLEGSCSGRQFVQRSVQARFRLWSKCMDFGPSS